MANIPFLNNAYFAAKVGIGTISPTQLLHVNSTTANPTGIGLQNSQRYYSVRSNNYSLVFTDETVGSERMRITSAGNVGIGTTTPTTKLYVYNGEATIASATDGVKLSYSNGNSSGIIDTAFSDNNLEFRTNGTAKMWIANGGNVGIGTTSPSYPLDVVGDGIRLTRNSKTFIFNADFASAGTHANIQSDAGMGLSFSTNASEKMRITSAGNVGIGTTSPDRKLEVDFTGSVFGARFTRSDATGSSTIEFANSAGVKSIIGYDAGVDGYKIGTASATNFVVKQSGNVGIGTSLPQSKLEVIDTIPSSIPALGLDSNLFQVGGGTYGTMFGSISNGNGYIQQQRFDGTATAYNLLLQPNGGNVGIGTTSPTRKLNVNGNVGINNQLLLDSANYGEHLTIRRGVYGYDTIVTGTRIDYSPTASTNTFKFLADLQTTGQLNVTGNAIVNGNVGIGTTSPSAKLDVAGTGNFTGLVSGITPVAAANFVTKAYVDGSGGGTGPFLPLAGGTMTGNIIQNGGNIDFSDGRSANFGNGDDLQIYHDGTHNYIDGITNDLYIRTVSPGDDVVVQAYDDLFLYTNNGLDAIIARGGAAVELYHNNSKKFETTNTGVTITGGWVTSGVSVAQASVEHIDNAKATFGNGNDLQIYHDGSNSYIKDVGTGFLNISSDAALVLSNGTGEPYFIGTSNGSVKLYYDNNKKLETGIVSVGTATIAGGTLIDGWKTTTQANAINDTTIATTAYVNNKIALIPAGLVFQGTWNAATNSPTLTSGSGTTGNFYIVSVAGSTNLDGITDWKVGDWAVFIEQGASDQWEKIDNSSVLDGIGTGGSVAGWAGSGTSNTLTNSPITFSGNNVSFAGNGTFAGSVIAPNVFTQNIYITSSGTNSTNRIDNDGTQLYLTYGGTSSRALEILNSNGNATFAGDVAIQKTGDVYLTLESTDATTTEEVAVKYSNQSTGSNYWWSGLNQSANYSLAYGTSYSGANVKMEISTAGNATFAGDVTIGSSGAPSDKTLNILTGGSKSAVKLMEAGTVYGFSTVYDGATNKFHINRHNNSAAGTPVLSLNRDDDNATLTGNLYFSGSHLISSNTADGSDNAQIIISGGGADGDTRGATVHLAGNENGNGGLLQLRAGAGAISQIRSYTSGSERMRIDSSGNVGIGTTSPLAKLNIESPLGGDIAFRLTQTSKNWWEFKNTGGTNDLNLSDAFGTYATFKNGGNVGIGTTSPRGKLDIVGNTDNDSDFLTIQDDDASAGSHRPSIRFRSNTAQIGQIVGLNGSMRFSSGTTENSMLEILDNGNVGIGTTTPGAKLNVVGTGTQLGTSGYYYNTFLKDTTNSGVLLGGNNTDNGVGFLAGVNELAFLTFGTSWGERMRINSAGNVGIGTTNPVYTLDVVSAGDGLLSLTGGTKPAMIFKVGTAVVGGIQAQANTSLNVSAYGTSSLNLQTAGTTPRLTILTGGNVGIGETSVDARLHITALASNGISNVKLESPGASKWAFGIPAGQTYFALDDVNDNLTTPKLVVLKTSGNVGIGTTSPDGLLHIDGMTSTIPAIVVEAAGSSDNVVMEMQNSSAAKRMTLQYDNANINFNITDRNNDPIITFRESGNIGIGLETPSSLLEMSGTLDNTSSKLLRLTRSNQGSSPAKAVGFYSNSGERGSITVSNFATAYNTSSDYRLKENIKAINNSVEKLMSLKPCNFNFISENKDKVVMDGFIAHEAKEVVPESVTGIKDAIDEEGNPVYQGIDQSKLVPLLTAALQEALQRIEILEQKINN